MESREPNGPSRPSSPRPPEFDPYRDPVALALLDLVDERGYQAVTAEDLIERAGIPPRQFFQRFEDKEGCVLRCMDAFACAYECRVESAYRRYSDWRTSLRAAAYEVADFVSENPKQIRLGAVELLQAKSEMIRVRREEAMSFGAKLIERGREGAPDPDRIPGLAAEMVIGAIVQLLTHKLQTGGEIDPHGMVPQMMYFAVRIYRGEEAAREELALPRPAPPPE